MGRRSRSSVAVVSGYSSNSTAGSSFRELDDAFLQKQTRIWLGEVLSTRLDEQVDISDLLADGELLHDISEVLWNLLLTKCAELWRLKANLKGPTASKKIGGRYMPYSNVDSFLKICKIFGLNGIDLFSPSDVVEKKNIRKVCICIRALSKKARSKQLHLPDFDIVTYAVAMPTDMVECLRKSLESPQSSFASSSTYNSYEQPRSKLKQVRKLVFAGDVKNNDVSSEESDEAESNCIGADSHLSSIDKLEISDVLDSDLENSPGAYSSTKIQKDDVGEEPSPRDQETQEVPLRSLKPSANHSRYDNVADNVSFFQENGDTLRVQINSAQDRDISLQNEYLASDKSHYSTEERDYISEYLAFSDSVVLGTDCGSPVLFDGEESTYNFFTGIDAHGSNLKGRDFETGSQRRDSDIDDEVSSTTSMTSILGRVLAMEFDDRFDIDDMLPMKDHPETFQDNKDEEYIARGTAGRCETEDMDECGTITGLTCDSKGHVIETEGENLNHYALPSTVKPKYIEKSSDSHRGQENNFRSTDVEHADECNEKSIPSGDNGSTGSNTIGSEFNYNQHMIAQDLDNKHSDLSAMSLENLCSSHKISDKDNKLCCHSYQEDEGTRQIESHGEPDGKKTTPKDGVHANFDIYPAGCIPTQEAYQPSVELVDNACIKGHQTCPSVEKDTDFAEFTNQDCQQPVVEEFSERRGDTNNSDNKHSDIKPHRKLFNRVAKGTAIAGVLFFLLQLSKRIGDENGKLGKKSRPTQIFGHSKASKQDGNQGSKRTVTSPDGLRDGVLIELGKHFGINGVLLLRLLHQAQAGLMRGEALIELVRERVKAVSTRLSSKL